MAVMKPVLIVGQGLAGTALAWQLWERAVPFLLVDADEPHTSSKVAAGLVTPITGMRLNLSERIAEWQPEALRFYREVERKLNGSFYHEVPHVRLFKSPKEVELWRARSGEEEIRAWVDEKETALLADHSQVHAELGGFVQRGSAWMDTRQYLAQSRQFFEAIGAWQQGVVHENTLEPSPVEVVWRGQAFSHVVFCRGAQEAGGWRFFPWLQWKCARGVIASLQTKLDDPRIFNRGGWVLPVGAGEWRAGSTYEFDFDRPLEESLEDLKKKLSGLLKQPFHFTDSQAGIRPILKSRAITMGRHPGHERVVLFNGLGSKGVLRSPACARMLVEHLLEGVPLEDKMDVRSNDI